jgi:hypothetical protein
MKKEASMDFNKIAQESFGDEMQKIALSLGRISDAMASRIKGNHPFLNRIFMNKNKMSSEIASTFSPIRTGKYGFKTSVDNYNLRDDVKSRIENLQEKIPNKNRIEKTEQWNKDPKNLKV